MDYLQQSFSVAFEYKVYFTNELFSPSNPLFHDFLSGRKSTGTTQKILFVVDKGVVDAHPTLLQNINNYFSQGSPVELVRDIIIVPGGEAAKNNGSFLNSIIEAVNTHKVDRHSYLAAVGGGALLDLAGYAATISHRGIKHIRIPTTVLSQNDSGVGVKNGINYRDKKNFLGTFSPPIAVFNDEAFLLTLNDRNWRSGISEAVKVALIKDAGFFSWLEEAASALDERDIAAMKVLIRRCADLHLQHIRSGDPFETGSSRPLDFGHWSAHKLEQLTNFEISHGEAVAMGIALDTMYSCLAGKISQADAYKVMDLLQKLGFKITHPLMEIEQEDSPILLGLQEFREHLGGRLTITILNSIGQGVEVNEIDWQLMKRASKMVKDAAMIHQ